MAHSTIPLRALDKYVISAYRSRPQTNHSTRYGLVIVQEVFGVTASVRQVADDYAHAGFEVLAPAFFDRIATGIELASDAAGMAKGREYVGQLGFDAPLRDVRAAAGFLLEQGCTAVAVVGYCWGGVVAYLSSTRLGLPAASYYGRLIPQFLHERPQAPVILHFGEQDELIPASSVRAIEQALPDLPLYRYPAGHAFNRIGDAHYHPASAQLARTRTMDFLKQHLGGI